MMISLPRGTITLAMKITAATGYEPISMSTTTPPRIVLSTEFPN
jgi:hypothetical protein